MVDGFTIKVNNPSSLDYDTTTMYVLTVRTTDSGGLIDDAILIINILPNNDHTPVFTTADATETIAEDTAVGTTIFT